MNTIQRIQEMKQQIIRAMPGKRQIILVEYKMAVRKLFYGFNKRETLAAFRVAAIHACNF